MFGVLVIISKKVDKEGVAGPWAHESFCIKKKNSLKKIYLNSIEQCQSRASKHKKDTLTLTMSSLTADKDDAGPDCGGVDLSVKF